MLESICRVTFSSASASESHLVWYMGAHGPFLPPSLFLEGAAHPLLTASCSALASAHLIHSGCFFGSITYSLFFLSDADIPALSFRFLECQSWQRVSSITWPSLFISQVGELKPREVKPRTRTLCQVYLPAPAVLCKESRFLNETDM